METLLNGEPFTFNLMESYFSCLQTCFPDIYFFPIKFVAEVLLLPKKVPKQKLRGFGLDKVLEAPWKYDLQDILLNIEKHNVAQVG